jgi:D-inositol-3-phosphate glycosyltransferase
MYPYRGGIAHFTDSTFRNLTERGHDVRGITFARQYPDVLFPGKSQMEPPEPGRQGTALRLIDTLNPLSWLRTSHVIGKERPDAVVYQFWLPFLGPAYGTIARRVGRRATGQIAVVHNALPHERGVGDGSLSRYFLRACSGFVVMSESVERDLRSLGIEGPVFRIAHPVYDHFGEAVPRAAARATLGLPPDAPVLLFFGFIRRYKGLHVLLESLSTVRERLPAVRLVVAGEFYEDEAKSRQFVEARGLREHVLFHPEYIPNDRVSLYFSAADVVVQPYVSATQSGVAQVAFHFGRPLIVTDVGGLAEIVPHERAGLVVPPDDPGALGRAIVRYFDEQLAEPLTRGVRIEKQKYGWDRLVNAVEGLAASSRSYPADSTRSR